MAAEQTQPSRMRVAVYGSCVARDAVDLAARDRVDVVDYIARQSLVSGGRDALAHLPQGITFSHDFQRRMLAADFRGDIDDRVRRLTDRVDVLLWDLTDERHGVHELSDGTIITRSIDLMAVPALMELADGHRRIVFGTDEHFALWAQRADHLVKILRDAALFEKVMVIRLPWALISLDGEPTPPSLGMLAIEANQAFERYYAHLEALGLAVIEVDDELVIADPEHRWGSAPFHYAQGVYDEIMRQVFERSARP